MVVSKIDCQPSMGAIKCQWAMRATMSKRFEECPLNAMTSETSIHVIGLPSLMVHFFFICLMN